MKTIKVISHRGVPMEAPEHSYNGYDLAITQGTRNIEQDLQLSKDGHLIVSHDDNLFRMTRIDGKIPELVFSEIQKHHFSNDETVHQLSEVFARYGNTINYVIETKFTYAQDGNYSGEEALLKAIREAHLINHVIFQSFVPESLRYLHQQMPEVPIMLLVEDESEDVKKLYNNLHIDIVCFDFRILTPAKVNAVHQKNKEAYIYFVSGDDTLRNLTRVLEMGIDGVFTDYTGRTIEFIKGKGMQIS